MKASDLLVRCLENEGVRYVFGLPGEEVVDIVDSLSRSSIAFVPTRHEQGAAFMADVYGRLTGRAGVCLSTLGPGATNLLTGVAGAHLDRSPLVALTGQASSQNSSKDTPQYIDTVALFRPVTKWSAGLDSPQAIPQVVRQAFRIAQTERPGAVHFSIPSDIVQREAEGEPLPVEVVEYPPPDPAAVLRAARFLREAQRPLILAGNGVLRRQAHRELALLAERIQAPVANTLTAKGAMDPAHPFSRMTVGVSSRDPARSGLDRADVVISVGYDRMEYPPHLWNPGGRARIVHVDTVPAEADALYHPEIEVVSDLPSSLAALAAACEPRPPAQPLAPLRPASPALTAPPPEAGEGPLLKPQAVLAALRRLLDPEDILVSDVGLHMLWIARLYPALRPNTVLLSNGLSAMGIGLPGAIAAKLAHPERRVVAVVGDGGFLMTSQELETARRLGTALVVLVWADGGYGMVEESMRRRLGRTSGVRFANPDLVQYAAAFGLPGFRVERPEELAPTLARALAMGLPTLVEAPIDYRESVELA